MGLLPACSSDDSDGGGGPPSAQGFITNQRIIYSDGLHNENTEMIRLNDRILLCFRGGEAGQTGSARARIKIYESTDDGRTFSPISEVSMPDDPEEPGGGRDIRDPKFVVMGDKLFLYCISRLPGFSFRDLDPAGRGLPGPGPAHSPDPQGFPARGQDHLAGRLLRPCGGLRPAVAHPLGSDPPGRVHLRGRADHRWRAPRPGQLLLLRSSDGETPICCPVVPGSPLGGC